MMMINADNITIIINKESRFIKIILPQSDINLGVGKVEKINEYLAKIIIPRLTEDAVSYVKSKYPIEILYETE